MLEHMPYKYYILCSIPESFLIITLGLIFLGLQKKWSIILITAFIQSTLLFVLMNIFNFTINVLLSYLTLVICTCLINKINYKSCFVALSFAISIALLIKGTTALAFVKITDLSFVEVF